MPPFVLPPSPWPKECLGFHYRDDIWIPRILLGLYSKSDADDKLYKICWLVLFTKRQTLQYFSVVSRLLFNCDCYCKSLIDLSNPQNPQLGLHYFYTLFAMRWLSSTYSLCLNNVKSPKRVTPIDKSYPIKVLADDQFPGIACWLMTSTITTANTLHSHSA